MLVDNTLHFARRGLQPIGYASPDTTDDGGYTGDQRSPRADDGAESSDQAARCVSTQRQFGHRDACLGRTGVNGCAG